MKQLGASDIQKLSIKVYKVLWMQECIHTK